jgi:hypothetical protein
LLTVYREGGYYEPISEEEFEDFRKNYPDLAKYFETGPEDEHALDSLPIPNVSETAPIYDNWDKAAKRLMN